MIARPPPQGGAPIDQIGGNEGFPQAIMSLLIRDCGGSSLWFQAILNSSCPSCSSWLELVLSLRSQCSLRCKNSSANVYVCLWLTGNSYAEGVFN